MIIPNMWKIKVMFQTTNQYLCLPEMECLLRGNTLQTLDDVGWVETTQVPPSCSTLCPNPYECEGRTSPKAILMYHHDHVAQYDD